MIKAEKNTGRMIGMMMRRYIAKPEAPSICAAFKISLSMPRRPARNKAMTKPELAHIPAIATQ